MGQRKETIAEKFQRVSNLPATETKTKLGEVLYYVNWSSVSREYFGMGNSWLYKKIEGHDTDGNPHETFTNEELIRLKEALKDIAKKIEECADNL